MGYLSNRADQFVSRILKVKGVAPQAPAPTPARKYQKRSILDDLAAQRRQILKRRGGL